MDSVTEIWKAVVGFEGSYEVSNLGRVRSLDRMVWHSHSGWTRRRGKMMSPATDSRGYPQIRLGNGSAKNRKGRRVHHLVMESFVGIRPSGHEVNHKNGDKTDNRVENLEYCTRGENLVHAYETTLRSRHGNGRLKESDVREAHAMVKAGQSRESVAAAYGIAKRTLDNILCGTNWRHLNLPRLAFWMLLWLAFVPSLIAQDIVITGLERPVGAGGFAIIRVTGIADAELAKAQVSLVPFDDRIIVERSNSIPRAWYVMVDRDAVSGKRSFIVSLNPFRSHLDEAAKLTAGMEEPDAKTLTELAKTLGAKYPYRFGSAVLEVTGSRPPPIVDPNQPPPIDPNQPPVLPTTKRQVTYVYEKDNNSVPRPVSLALQRLNAESSGSVLATEFEEDTVSGNGQTPAQYVIALKAAQQAGLPALVIQSGATVLRVVKAPTTEKEVLDAAK